MKLTVEVQAGTRLEVLKHLITVQKHLLDGANYIDKKQYGFNLKEVTTEWK